LRSRALERCDRRRGHRPELRQGIGGSGTDVRPAIPQSGEQGGLGGSASSVLEPSENGRGPHARLPPFVAEGRDEGGDWRVLEHLDPVACAKADLLVLVAERLQQGGCRRQTHGPEGFQNLSADLLLGIVERLLERGNGPKRLLTHLPKGRRRLHPGPRAILPEVTDELLHPIPIRQQRRRAAPIQDRPSA
jgi:hypothetical protein